MSQFSGAHRDSRTPTPTSSPPHDAPNPHKLDSADSFSAPLPQPNYLPQGYNLPGSVPASPIRGEHAPSPESVNDSPSASPHGRKRSSSRPLSMVQTFQPPLMDVNEDTIPELQPIFTFLNSHANKLYQEGYFLKLDDQNTRASKPLPLPPLPSCCPRAAVAPAVISNADGSQKGDRTPIGRGQNALRSWSERCSPSGMPPSWMPPARTARSSPSSLT